VLTTPSADGQQWPKHVKADVHILLSFIHLMDHATSSFIEKCNGVKMPLIKIIHLDLLNVHGIALNLTERVYTQYAYN
jgi:hypothetical protein